MIYLLYGRPQVALLFCTIFMIKSYGLAEQIPVVFVGKGLAPSAFYLIGRTKALPYSFNNIKHI